MDKTILKVKKYIEDENLIKNGDKVVIGVSGGADSVCLLSILNNLKDCFNLSLEVVHINHLIRDDAKDDALYVKELCDKFEIPFHLYEVDVESLAKNLHISTEDAGRRVRYNAFNEIAGDIGKIAVAHNKNDKVETFFINLFRGAGINGLCSIKNKRDNIIRPIICLERSEIEEYLNRNHLSFKIDSTNNTTIYTRNKIRNKIIPYVKEEIQPNVIGNISKTMEIMEETNDFFNDFVNDFCNEYVKFQEENIFVDLEAFNNQKEIIKKLVLFKVLEYFIPSKKDITSKNIQDILNICTKNGKKEVCLLNDLKVIKNFGLLSIHYTNTIPQINILSKSDKGIATNEGTFAFDIVDINNISLEEIMNSKNRYEKYFDFDKLNLNEISINYINPNDFIYINNSKEPKPLKDLFNKNKIKGDYIVISHKGNVLWVVDNRISDYFKVTDNTKKVLIIKKIK